MKKSSFKTRHVYDDINDTDVDDWAEEEGLQEEENSEKKEADNDPEKQTGKRKGDKPPDKDDSKSAIKKGAVAAAVIAAAGILVFILVTQFAANKVENKTNRISEEMQRQINSELYKVTPATEPEASPETQPVADMTPGAVPEIAEPDSDALNSDELEAFIGVAVPTDTKGYSRIAVAEANASSELTQAGIDNSAAMAFDVDQSTSWQEGASGYGEGEILEADLGKQSYIHCLTFKLGNWREEKYYYQNGRPAQLTVWLDDNSFSVEFPDNMEEYCLRFSYDVPCSVIYIRIDAVYEGNAYQDTCISEIGIYGN